MLFDDEIDTPTLSTEKPSSALIATPSSTGLGLAPQTPAPRMTAEKEVLSGMSPMGRVGIALQSFGNAVTGRPDPVAGLVQERQREKLLQLQEFKAHTGALEDSVKMVKGLKGPARDQFIEQQAANLAKVNPSLGEAFKALAQRPDMSTAIAKYTKDLPQLQMAFELGGEEAVYKLMQSPDFMKEVEKRADVRATPVVMQKVRGMVMGLQQIAPPDMLARFNKDGVITASEVMELNEHLKSTGGPFAKLALDDEQTAVLGRNGKTIWGPLGVLSGDQEQQLMLDRAKKGDDAPKTRKISRGQTEVDQEWDGTKWVDVGSGPRFKPGGDGDNVDMKPATVSVDGKNVAALVDKKGNYYDANTRQPLRGAIGPQLTDADQRRSDDRAKNTSHLDNMEKAINTLEGIAQRSPRSAAGMFSAPARAIEYVAGSLNPEGTKSTPATTALQLRDMIVSNMNNLGRLSQQDRQRIENALQIGAGGNPANLPLAIGLLRDAVKKERSAIEAPKGRTIPGGGAKPSVDELLRKYGG